MKKVFWLFLGLVLPHSALSSIYTGQITLLRFSSETSPRVSINVGQPTGCSGSWYAYNNADSGIGKIWTSALMTAHTTKNEVVITGSGVCDQYGIEGISFIELK